MTDKATGNERPEYEVCLSDTHADHKGLSWCGKHVIGFAFADVDHAAQNGRGGGRLVVCRDCLPLAVAALRNGWVCEGTRP